MGDKSGVLGAAIAETPIAVFDFETTGLYPGGDRVVEVCVVRIEPRGTAQVVLDTLVNPCRPVAATEVHGIRDQDVVDAPPFSEVAGDFVRALSGCVVAAYNVYFDIRFLRRELARAGIELEPPHVCLMYLRPMLGLGQKCPLGDVCRESGIVNPAHHTARGDALAAAGLIPQYSEEMERQRIATFGDLVGLGDYKFLQSLGELPLTKESVSSYAGCKRIIPRRPSPSDAVALGETSPSGVTPATRSDLADYWDALQAAMADLQITHEELATLVEKKHALAIPDAQVRMLHARLFSGIISQFIDDEWLDAHECSLLHRVYSALSKLGWAPGESMLARVGQPRGTGPAAPIEPIPPVSTSKKESQPASARARLRDSKVVLTGTFRTFSRKEAKDAVKAAGGKVTSGVSRKTDFLVVGACPGSKLAIASALGVETIDEEEFRRRLGRNK